MLSAAASGTALSTGYVQVTGSESLNPGENRPHAVSDASFPLPADNTTVPGAGGSTLAAAAPFARNRIWGPATPSAVSLPS